MFDDLPPASPPPRQRRGRRAPTVAELTNRARAMLGTRALKKIGPHQYAIEGSGRTLHNDKAVWHVDLGKVPPFCDCPAFINCPTPQTCKHIAFLQQVEQLMGMVGND